MPFRASVYDGARRGFAGRAAHLQHLVMIGVVIGVGGWFGRSGGLGIYLAPGVTAATAVPALRAAAGGRQALFIRSNADIRTLSMSIFERTFVITRVLYWLAAGVAAIGLVSALLAWELERARALALLRTLGITPWGTATLVIAQTLFPRVDKPRRVAAYEILTNSHAVANLIREGKTHQIPSIMQTQMDGGNMTFEFHLKKLVADGRVDKETADVFNGKKEKKAEPITTGTQNSIKIAASNGIRINNTPETPPKSAVGGFFSRKK